MNLKRINKGNSQVLTKDDGTQVLISYSTPVAARIINECGATWYKTGEYHSKTTSKHINQWLEGVKAEVRPQSFFDSLV